MWRWWASLEHSQKKIFLLTALATVIGTVIAGIILMIPNFVTNVASALTADKLIKNQPRSGETASNTETSKDAGGMVEQPPPPVIKLVSLLRKSREEEDVRNAFKDLGKSEQESVDHGGKAFCFKLRGMEFLFDAEDRLDKVRLFSGLPDEHQHAIYKESLPLGIQFGMLRAEAQTQIDTSLHRHVEPELGVGDWDKYELEGYRLYLNYSELDGKKRICEVQLVRPEVFQRAALAP